MVRELPKTIFSFRSLDVLNLKRDELMSVTVQKAGEDPLNLVRNAKGKWVLEEHENRQNDGQIQLFLTALTGLRAAAWAGEMNPEYGLDQPSLEIKIRTSRRAKTPGRHQVRERQSGNQHYGVSTEEEGVFLIDDEQFNQIEVVVEKVGGRSCRSS